LQLNTTGPTRELTVLRPELLIARVNGCDASLRRIPLPFEHPTVSLVVHPCADACFVMKITALF